MAVEEMNASYTTTREARKMDLERGARIAEAMSGGPRETAQEKQNRYGIQTYRQVAE